MELTDPLSELYGLPPGAAVLLPQRTEMRMAFVLVACHWRVPFAQRWYDRTYRLPALGELRLRMWKERRYGRQPEA